MKSKKLRGLISWLLCLCMVTGLLPVTALAADAPAITTESLAEDTAGEEYTAQLTATASDPNGELTWEAEGLPQWLTLADNLDGSAALSGTPDEAGEVTFTVTVTETIPAPAEEPATADLAEGAEHTEGAEPAQPTVRTASREYTLTVAEAVNEPGTEPEAEAGTEPGTEPEAEAGTEPGTGDPLLPTDSTDGENLRTTTGSMSAEIYTGQDSYGGFTGKTDTFAVGDTVILHSFKFSPALATGSTAHSIGILSTSKTDPNQADIFWHEKMDNGTINNKPENNVLQLIGFQLGSNVSPGTYRFVIWAGPNYQNETVYNSTETFTVTGGTGGTVTASSYTASFATDEDFSNPVTSVAADGTQYYFKAEGFDPALAYTQDSAQYSYDVTVRTTTGIQILGLSKKTTVSNINSVIQYVLKGPDAITLPPGSYTLVMDIYSVSKSTGAREHIFTCTSTNQMVVTETSVGMPAITTNSPLPDGMTGQAYSQTLEATPVTEGNPITWSLASGSLPTGLTLNTDGSITGTPTEAGTYTFTVTAWEAEGVESSKSFTITVRTSLQITTDSLPNATLDLYYNQYLYANLTGVTWSLKEGGSLPPGLSLMSYSNYGCLSGTPTTAGTYTFTVVATDGTQTAEKTFTITVSNTFTFTSNGVDSDAVGAYCYLTAKQSGRTITLWSGAYSRDQAIPVSTRYAGDEVSDVELYTYLSRSGKVVLASYTGAITLTDDRKAALAAVDNPIVTLPDIQQDFDPDVASGVTVRPYYKDSRGYSFSGGDLVPNETSYTLSASISNGSQEFYQKYDTRKGPTFTVDEEEKPTFSLPGDLGKTVSMTYPKWVLQDVIFTLVPKNAGEDADLSGFRLAFSQSLRNTTYTVTEEIEEDNTVTVRLYTGQPVSVTFYDSDLYRITNPYILDFAGKTDIPYQKNSVGSAGIGVTASLANNDADFGEYAAKLSGSYLRPSVTALGKTWQASRSAPASRLVTTEGKPKTYTLNVYSSSYADTLETLITSGGTYHLAWADNGAVMAGSKNGFKWKKDNLYTKAEGITLNLRGGLLLDLNFSDGESYQQMVGWWYQQDGNGGDIWLRADTTGVFPGQRSYAFFCPGDEGTYNFLLLPSDAMSPTGMAWDEVVAAYSSMPQVTDIPVKNNTVVRKSASMTDTFFANAKYDTLPNSTLSGPEQYSSLTDALTFTGHIELDEDKQGRIYALRIKAAGTDSGGRVATQISSVVVDGKSYPYAQIELSGGDVIKDKLVSKQFETYYQITFTKPVELPCDISIYGKPMRLSSHCVLDVTAQVEVNGKSGKSWQPVGTVTAKAPTISVEMPRYTSGGTVLAYLSIPGGGTVDVYDGDVLVLSRVSRGAVSIPLSGTAKGRSTTHTLTFQSSADDTQLEPVSQTVVHLDGVPKLTSQYLRVSGNKGSTWGNYGRGSIYSYASGSPPLFRATCTIENAENIAGSVVFRVDRLDGTTAYMTANRNGNKFTTNAFSGSPVIGATALFEPNWEKIQSILPNQMPNLPTDSPSVSMSASFAETVVVPYEEHRIQLPEKDTVSYVTQEEIDALKAFQRQIEQIYEDHDGQAGFYQIIDIGTGQFTSAHDMITGLDTNSIPQGDTGTTTMTRELTSTELTTELGSGNGDWSRYTFTEPDGSTGLEVYTQTVTTGGGAGEGGVSGTITIATDGETTVEFATAQGTGTGSGDVTLPDSGTISSGGGGGGFSFTNFGSDGMNVFTNICGDVTAGSGLIKDITAAVTGAEATGVFSPLEKGLGAFTFAKDMMDGMSSQLTLADLLNAPNKWLSSRCAQKLSPEFRANMQRQIDSFIKDVRDAEGWNMAVTGANYILGAGGMAGLFTNPWTGIIGGAAAWFASKISGMKLDNVQKQAVLLKDIIDLQIEKTARASGDMECMGVSGTRHSYAVCIDPSGIVYEAVLSNPVEGATVKLYTADGEYVPDYGGNEDTLENYVDENGDPISPINSYSGQGSLTTPAENTTDPADSTQITGANGRYQWMVPQGLWYVTAEKEGYQSGDSGKDVAAVVNAGGLNWLPVLPEQLNVNIPLISYDAPEAEVEFRPDGVYIQFSKYMDNTTLTENNFTLTGSGGQKITITGVELLNSEQAPNNIRYSGGTAPSYTSQVWLKANLSEGAEVSLKIGADVKTYADIAWGGGDLSGNVTQAAAVAAPSFDTIDEKPYGTTVTLTIPEGAAVYYTTDDNDPSETNGTRYYGETILLTDTATIKAIAVKLGVKSSVVGRTFTVNQPANAVIGDPDNQPGGDDEPDEPTPVVPGGTSDSKDDSYSVSVPAMSDIRGGSITVSPRSAEKGDTVTITVKPDDGYELDTLTVTDGKGSEVELTGKSGGRYTFTMPASNVKIRVSFRETAAQTANPFTDVSGSAYYCDAVLWAVANGVTNGTTATTFSPNVTVTRAQMVTFLWRAHGSPRATGSNPFTDVSSSAYYYDAVLWAVEHGVTNGTTATTFGPNAPVTRAQAVTFQWRAAGSPVVAGDSFDDVAADAYYAGAVTWAVANGITNGTGGNKFSPEVTVTRAQAVTFLWRELA